MGCKFFLTKDFFPYHSQICGLKWEELNGRMQTLILSLMHAVGVCLFPLSFVLLAITIKLFYSYDKGIELLITITSVLLFIGLFRVTFGIFKKTKANTPWKLVLILLSINVASLITQLIQ